MRVLRALFLCVIFLGPLLVTAQPVTQPFTFNIVGQALPTLNHGSVSWGDVDADGDLDAFVSGISGSGIVSALYLNEGPDSEGKPLFVLQQSDFKNVAYSFSSFGDYDGDGDLDLVVGGSETIDFPFNSFLALYRNDGSAFSEVSSSNLPHLHSGSASWGDLDGDGDLDLVLSGVTSSDEMLTALATNNGDGSFEVKSDEIVGVGYGDTDLGDIDGDLDLDILISGATKDGFQTMVIRNDAGSFAPISGAFGSFAFSSVDYGDFDNDGDLDLVVSGGTISELIFDGSIEIWKNDQGSFSRLDTNFDGILAGDASWGDFDNDGDLDLLTIGAEAALGSRTARIYRNDGGDTFVISTLLVGSIFSDADWGDYDGDGDLDLLTTGRATQGPTITNLYENQRQVIPPLPSAPSGLIADVIESRVDLSWIPPVQSVGPNGTLTYNVRVGRTPQGSEVVSAMALSDSGRLLKAHPGNAASAQNMSVENLENGTYFWSVQAVNHAFASSPFAIEGTFEVDGALSVDTEDDSLLPNRFRVYSNFPNPFSSRTTIRFDLPEGADVELRVFSLLGQEVMRISRGFLAPGSHQLDWDGHSSSGIQMGSGIYFYELRAGDRVQSSTMTLLR